MKLNLAKKKRQSVKEATAEIFDLRDACEDTIVQFNKVMDSINEELVDRSNEIEGLKHCILSSQHLLLEGSHGIAKSMLARSAFARIAGAKTFFHQFSEATQADQVVGCMDTKEYREKATWKHNTTGMLPEADFAYLDELFRAGPKLLPLSMGILNEREFFNGASLVRCPLITAVATTNFVLNDEELKAFNDRFLVRLKVKSLSTKETQLTAIRRFLAREAQSEVATPETISLGEIRQIQDVCRAVEIPESVLDLYLSLLARFRKEIPQADVSDRRMCQGLKLAQVAYVLDTKRPDILGAGYLAASAYAFGNGDQAHVEAFTKVYEEVIGQYIRSSRVVKTLDVVGRRTEEMTANFDDSMPLTEALEMFSEVCRYSTALQDSPSTLTPEESKKTVELIDKLTTLENTLRPFVKKAIDQGLIKP